MYTNYSDTVRTVIDFAREEAAQLGHDVVDSGHVLIGMLREGESIAAKALHALKIDIDELRGHVQEAHFAGVGGKDNVPFTLSAVKDLERALEVARGQYRDPVDIDHVLFAIADSPRSAASQILTSMGVKTFLIRTTVFNLMKPESEAGRDIDEEVRDSVSRPNAPKSLAPLDLPLKHSRGNGYDDGVCDGLSNDDHVYAVLGGG